jgi:tRNA(fMet)-specific endonuclease VapC
MLILDTNHFSELERATDIGLRLQERLEPFRAATFVSIITAEESMRGWLSRITPGKDRGVTAYGRFQRGLELIGEWSVLGWDDDAADVFDDLAAQRLRVGTLDLRIASIALAYDATLLTRNLPDFRKVPGLKIENWLD